jgi:AcrR family transcriptional regulator
MQSAHRPAQHPEPSSGDTKARIVEAALETLKAKGFAGTSAREIAKTGGFNQALIFYHFGSVKNLLLAGLDVVGERRMRAYRPAFEHAETLSDLAALARDIYRDDLEHGYVTVLGEMVAGGVSDRELGAQVVARLQPWLELVEWKVRALVAGSLFESMISPPDLAFAIIALYLGVDMLSHLDGDRTRTESLLELWVRAAPLAQALLPGVPPAR